MLFLSCSATQSGKYGPSHHTAGSFSASAAAHARFNVSAQMGTVFDNASGNRFTELLVASTMTHPPAFAASSATRSFSRVLEKAQLLL